MCAATRAAAASTPPPQRYDVLSAQGRRVGPGRHEQPRVGATEGLGGGVGVAQEHEVDPAPGDDDPQQAQRGRGELLGVVDDDQPQPGAQPVERLEVGLEVVGRGAEDPGRVERPRRRQRGHLVVLAQHVGGATHSGRSWARPEHGEVLGVEAELDGAHQQVAQLTAEGAGGQGQRQPAGQGGADRLARGVAGEQLTEDDVLLGAAEQARGGLAGQCRRLAQDAEPEGLVGARQRGGRGATEPGGDGVAQPGGREPGRREQEAAVGRGLTGLDPLGDDLDRDGGQAGSRGAEHPQHRAAVLDDRALARVEHRHACARRWRDDEGRAPRDSTTRPGHRQTGHPVPRSTNRSRQVHPARPVPSDQLVDVGTARPYPCDLLVDAGTAGAYPE